MAELRGEAAQVGRLAVVQALPKHQDRRRERIGREGWEPTAVPCSSRASPGLLQGTSSLRVTGFPGYNGGSADCQLSPYSGPTNQVD